LASGNKVLTAIHEWTHATLYWTPEAEKVALGIKEYHAAAVQYAVATHFGIPAEYSADYIINGGNDEKTLRSEPGQLHWVLDLAFREDESRMRLGHADEHLAALRHISLNLLRQEHSSRGGIHTKRLKAGWYTTYLQRVLAGVN